uniref:Uncharacterized protein n=1 Tax=Ceratitis capitata TaxID=7213 RepID=W8B8I2_CERCA
MQHNNNNNAHIKCIRPSTSPKNQPVFICLYVCMCPTHHHRYIVDPASRRIECPALQFICNGTCVDWSLHCNGKIDCDDEVDERDCDGKMKYENARILTESFFSNNIKRTVSKKNFKYLGNCKKKN